jgi:hypothetical protein
MAKLLLSLKTKITISFGKWSSEALSNRVKSQDRQREEGVALGLA